MLLELMIVGIKAGLAEAPAVSWLDPPPAAALYIAGAHSSPAAITMFSWLTNTARSQIVCGQAILLCQCCVLTGWLL